MKNVNANATASDAEGSEGRPTGGKQRSRQEIVDMVQTYLETLDNTWNAPQEEKEQEYRRLKLLIKYQLGLSSPVPLLISMMELDDKANRGKSTAAAGFISIPDGLKGKIAQIAKERLHCSDNEAVIMLLSEGCSKYKPEKKILSDSEPEEGDEDI